MFLIFLLTQPIGGLFHCTGRALTWQALKVKFEETSTTKLHGLTMKFDTFKMYPEYTIKQYLRVMAFMIHELKIDGSNLIDEQQFLVVKHSLHNSWETMTEFDTMKTSKPLMMHRVTWSLRLSILTMKFDACKVHSKHTIKQHLRAMSSIIHELKILEIIWSRSSKFRQ